MPEKWLDGTVGRRQADRRCAWILRGKGGAHGQAAVRDRGARSARRGRPPRAAAARHRGRRSLGAAVHPAEGRGGPGGARPAVPAGTPGDPRPAGNVCAGPSHHRQPPRAGPHLLPASRWVRGGPGATLALGRAGGPVPGSARAAGRGCGRLGVSSGPALRRRRRAVLVPDAHAGQRTDGAARVPAVPRLPRRAGGLDRPGAHLSGVRVHHGHLQRELPGGRGLGPARGHRRLRLRDVLRPGPAPALLRVHRPAPEAARRGPATRSPHRWSSCWMRRRAGA